MAKMIRYLGEVRGVTSDYAKAFIAEIMGREGEEVEEVVD